MIEKIDAGTAIRLLDAGKAVAVDVREPDEFAVGHIPGTGDAWGEWDAEGAATAVQEVGDDSLQASVGLDTPTFADALPTGDYLQAYSEEQGLGFAGQAAMYILSGVIGVAVLTIAFRLISLTVKESGAHGDGRAA